MICQGTSTDSHQSSGYLNIMNLLHLDWIQFHSRLKTHPVSVYTVCTWYTDSTLRLWGLLEELFYSTRITSYLEMSLITRNLDQSGSPYMIWWYTVIWILDTLYRYSCYLDHWVGTMKVTQVTFITLFVNKSTCLKWQICNVLLLTFDINEGNLSYLHSSSLVWIEGQCLHRITAD